MNPSTPGILALESHLRGFQRHLRAANRSPRTIEKYDLCARQLIEFLERTGMPTATTSVRRENVEVLIQDIPAPGRPAAPASTPLPGLPAFFPSPGHEGGSGATPPVAVRAPVQ